MEDNPGHYYQATYSHQPEWLILHTEISEKQDKPSSLCLNNSLQHSSTDPAGLTHSQSVLLASHHRWTGLCTGKVLQSEPPALPPSCCTHLASMWSKRCCQRSLTSASLSLTSAAFALSLAWISCSPSCFRWVLFSLKRLISSMQSCRGSGGVDFVMEYPVTHTRQHTAHPEANRSKTHEEALS